jgi:hypothetical protein
MKHAVKMVPGDMICIPVFIQIGSVIVDRGIHRHTDSTAVSRLEVSEEGNGYRQMYTNASKQKKNNCRYKYVSRCSKLYVFNSHWKYICTFVSLGG